MARSRVGKIAAMTGRIREYLREKPDSPEETLMQELKISRNSLYHCLSGLTEDKEVCQDGEFRLLCGGRRLRVKELARWFDGDRTLEEGSLKQAERLLYLYTHLHAAIPDGGLTIRQLEGYYTDLMEQSGRRPSSQAALRRMIYRDLNALENIGIAVDRPSTGNKKYCLRASYLPKLVPESAAAVYVGMMVFQDTVLDEAISRAKRELERAFFKKPPRDPRLLRDRIHIVADTLVHPEHFGNKFGILIRAVTESHRVSITYAKMTGETSDRVVEPVGMICKRGVWYLVARLADNGQYRTFRMDQIEWVSARTSETFPYPEGFTVEEYVGASWGVFTNDKVQVVRLRFSPEVAPRIRNVRYHRTQNIIEEGADGSVTVQFEVCGLVELKSWLLQWGTQVEILEPAELREMVVASARAIADRYVAITQSR